MSLKIIPLELKELNQLISTLHRHHKPVVGHRWSSGVESDGVLVGGCSVGRPVAPKTDQRRVVEVTRLVTDGTKNACSILYARSARIAHEKGYIKIQTFILENEPGTSLLAAGWQFESLSNGGEGWQSRPGRRTDQPTCRKQKWSKVFS